ncbi:hypothetical protein MRX96_007856 [Rhipicephalus microplus]
MVYEDEMTVAERISSISITNPYISVAAFYVDAEDQVGSCANKEPASRLAQLSRLVTKNHANAPTATPSPRVKHRTTGPPDSLICVYTRANQISISFDPIAGKQNKVGQYIWAGHLLFPDVPIKDAYDLYEKVWQFFSQAEDQVILLVGLTSVSDLQQLLKFAGKCDILVLVKHRYSMPSKCVVTDPFLTPVVEQDYKNLAVLVQESGFKTAVGLSLPMVVTEYHLNSTELQQQFFL